MKFVGTIGNDRIQGGASDDLIKGLGGNDQLYGDDGDDTILGGVGADYIEGMNGNDVLHGGSGDDDSPARMSRCAIGRRRSLFIVPPESDDRTSVSFSSAGRYPVKQVVCRP